jgi:uncharacterized protein (TIGR03067 family)
MLSRGKFLIVVCIMAVLASLPEQADSRQRCRRRCCTRSCERLISRDFPPQEIAMGERAKSDEERIRGTWQVVSSQFNGKDEQGDNSLLVFGRDWVSDVTPGASACISEPYKLRTNTVAKEIDGWLVVGEGIYRLEGNTLTICRRGLKGKSRPTEFATRPGDDRQLLALKRVSQETDPAKFLEPIRTGRDIGPSGLPWNYDTGLYVFPDK